MATQESEDVLPAELRPFVRRNTRVEPRRGGEDLVIVGQYLDYSLEGTDAQKVSKVMSLLDGQNSLANVARKARIDLHEVRSIVQPLYCEGLVGEQTDVAVPATLFYEHSRKTPRECFTDFDFLERFFTNFFGERASTQLFVGFLLEDWYYTKTNPIHLAIFVAKNHNPAHFQMWSKYYTDE
jgi:hypothetical protein